MGTALSVADNWYSDDTEEHASDQRHTRSRKRAGIRTRTDSSEEESRRQERTLTGDRNSHDTANNSSLQITNPRKDQRSDIFATTNDNQTHPEKEEVIDDPPLQDEKLKRLTVSNSFYLSPDDPPSALYLIGPTESKKYQWFQKEWLPSVKRILSIDRVTIFPSSSEYSQDTYKCDNEDGTKERFNDIVDPCRQRQVLEAAVQPSKTFMYTITTAQKPSKWWVIVFDRKIWQTPPENDTARQTQFQLKKTLFFYRRELGIIPVCIMDTNELFSCPKHIIESFYTTADRALFQTQGLQPDRQEVARRTPELEEQTQEWLQSSSHYLYLRGRQLQDKNDSGYPLLFRVSDSVDK